MFMNTKFITGMVAILLTFYADVLMAATSSAGMSVSVTVVRSESTSNRSTINPQANIPAAVTTSLAFQKSNSGFNNDIDEIFQGWQVNNINQIFFDQFRYPNKLNNQNNVSQSVVPFNVQPQSQTIEDNSVVEDSEEDLDYST